MAEEIHFTNVDAAYIYNEIVGSLEARVGEPLYPGDERRIFAEALVPVFVSLNSKIDDAARQKSLRFARGVVLDALGERVGVIRKGGTPSHVTLRFSIASARQLNTLIPKGVRATSDGTTEFVTDSAAILQAGSLYVDVAASSAGGTAATNNAIPAGGIATLIDPIEFVAVVNIDSTHGGDDGEPYDEVGDNVFRERIRLSGSRRSTAGPRREYVAHAMAADPRIADVCVSTPEPGVVLVLPLLIGGVLPTVDVLDKVSTALNAEGVRPDTDNVIVRAPNVQLYDISVKYYVTHQAETAAINAIEGAGGAIDQYNTWQQCVIGRTINPDELRLNILLPDHGNRAARALRVDINAPALVHLDRTTVAQFSGNLIVSHEVVDE